MNLSTIFKLSLIVLITQMHSSCSQDKKTSKRNLGLEAEKSGPSETDTTFASLKSFGNCSETKAWIEARLIAKLEKSANDQIQAMRCQFGGDAEAKSPACNLDRPEAAKSTQNDSQKASAPESTSDTNNQVAGVEEADLVKTQGQNIFLLSSDKLYILQGWPSNQAKILSAVQIEGEPLEMFVEEQGRVIVISQKGSSFQEGGPAPIDGVAIPQPLISEPMQLTKAVDLSSPIPGSPESQKSRVLVTTVDIADVKQPKILTTRSFEGSYQSARRIGTDLRIIVRDQLGEVAWPQVNWPNSRSGLAEVEAALKDLVEVTKNRIRTKDLNYWLNNFQSQTSGEPTNPPGQVTPSQCEGIYAPTFQTTLGLTRIISLRDAERSIESILLADTSGLYASTNALYLTTPDMNTADFSISTIVHKFAWEAQGTSKYLGSGSVAGTILNQFAMDEYEGNLRIVATSRDPKTSQSATKISVLSQGQGVLNVVGVTEPIARGERVFSVRFAGDRGFVVTFKQIDPLFTLNLKDPAHPKVVGELKIPGFSSYIHMMDQNTLLTIGRGGEGIDVSRPKISVFDVSDLANPKETKAFILGDLGQSYSPADSDHKAFNYNERLGVLAFPLQTDLWTKDGRQIRKSSIVVFDVKNQPTIKNLGSIDMAFDQKPGSEMMSLPLANRSLFMEDYLYGFSNQGMKVRQMGKLDLDVAVVPIPN